MQGRLWGRRKNETPKDRHYFGRQGKCFGHLPTPRTWKEGTSTTIFKFVILFSEDNPHDRYGGDETAADGLGHLHEVVRLSLHRPLLRRHVQRRRRHDLHGGKQLLIFILPLIF